MSARDAFAVESFFDRAKGHAVTKQVAVCRCGAKSSVMAAHGTLLNVAKLAPHFRRLGWKIGSRRADDTCPQCLRGRAGGGRPRPHPAPDRELTPAQKRAAYCRIADVPRAAPPTASKPFSTTPSPSEPDMPAEPPPKPSREQIRAIQNALDEHYLCSPQAGGGCYRKSWSDAALAEKLKTPRAWVSEERERAYGPDVCEDDLAGAKRLGELEAQLRAAADKALNAAAEAEAALAAFSKQKDALLARQVAA